MSDSLLRERERKWKEAPTAETWSAFKHALKRTGWEHPVHVDVESTPEIGASVVTIWVTRLESVPPTERGETWGIRTRLVIGEDLPDSSTEIHIFADALDNGGVVVHISTSAENGGYGPPEVPSPILRTFFLFPGQYKVGEWQ